MEVNIKFYNYFENTQMYIKTFLVLQASWNKSAYL